MDTVQSEKKAGGRLNGHTSLEEVSMKWFENTRTRVSERLEPKMETFMRVLAFNAATMSISSGVCLRKGGGLTSPPYEIHERLIDEDLEDSMLFTTGPAADLIVTIGKSLRRFEVNAASVWSDVYALAARESNSDSDPHAIKVFNSAAFTLGLNSVHYARGIGLRIDRLTESMRTISQHDELLDVVGTFAVELEHKAEIVADNLTNAVTGKISRLTRGAPVDQST